MGDIEDMTQEIHEVTNYFPRAFSKTGVDGGVRMQCSSGHVPLKQTPHDDRDSHSAIAQPQYRSSDNVKSGGECALDVRASASQ